MNQTTQDPAITKLDVPYVDVVLDELFGIPPYAQTDQILQMTVKELANLTEQDPETIASKLRWVKDTINKSAIKKGTVPVCKRGSDFPLLKELKLDRNTQGQTKITSQTIDFEQVEILDLSEEFLDCVVIVTGSNPKRIFSATMQLRHRGIQAFYYEHEPSTP